MEKAEMGNAQLGVSQEGQLRSAGPDPQGGHEETAVQQGEKGGGNCRNRQKRRAKAVYMEKLTRMFTAHPRGFRQKS